MNKQTIIGTLVGGVMFFILGALIYGMLLMSFMEENTNASLWRAPEDMIWGAMILSNFIWAYFLTMVFNWSATTGFPQGMQRGLLLGLVSGLAIDLGLYSNSTYFNSLTPALVDVIAVSVMTAITGGVLGALRKPQQENA